MINCNFCNKQFKNLKNHLLKSKCGQIPIIEEQKSIIEEQKLDLSISDDSLVNIISDDLKQILSKTQPKFHNMIQQAITDLNIDQQSILYYNSLQIYNYIKQQLIDSIENRNYEIIKLFSFSVLQVKEFKLIKNAFNLNFTKSYLPIYNGQFNQVVEYKQNININELQIDKILSLNQLSIKQLKVKYIFEQLNKVQYQQLQKCLLTKQSDQFIVQIESLYDSRYMTLFTIEQMIQLAEDPMFFKQNTIHQVISPYISDYCNLYFDIDHLEELSKNTFIIDEFFENLEIAINYVSKMFNSQIINKIFIVGANKYKSCHLYTNITIHISSIFSMVNQIKLYMSYQMDYNLQILDKLIDLLPYPKKDQYRTLRLDIFGKKIKKTKQGIIIDSDDENSDQEEIKKDESIPEIDLNKRIDSQDFKLSDILIMNTQSINTYNIPVIQLNHKCFQYEFLKEDIEEEIVDNQYDQIVFQNYNQLIANITITEEIEKEYNNHKFYKVRYNGECPICKRTHKQLNQHFNKFKSFVTCFRSPGIKVKLYDYQQRKLSLNSTDENETNQKLLTAQLKQEFEITHNGIKQSFNYTIQSNKTTFVKSHCGTGKTYQISQNIKQLLKVNSKLRVLYLSTRISFSQSITRQFEIDYGLQFSIYNDQELKKDQKLLNEQQMLMIQVECLPKITNSYDIVVIDECLSVFNQIQSAFGDKYQILYSLKMLLNLSKYNIILDAFLNDYMYKFYLSMISNKDHQIINNSYQPYNKSYQIEEIKDMPYEEIDMQKVYEQYNKQQQIHDQFRNTEYKELNEKLRTYFNELKDLYYRENKTVFKTCFQGLVLARDGLWYINKLPTYQCRQKDFKSCLFEYLGYSLEDYVKSNNYSEEDIDQCKQQFVQYQEQIQKLYDISKYYNQFTIQDIESLKKQVDKKIIIKQELVKITKNNCNVNFIIGVNNQKQKFINHLIQTLKNKQKVVSVFACRTDLEYTEQMLINNKILTKDQILVIHGDNLKQNEQTGKKHIQEKLDYYNKEDKTNHDQIQWIAYTKSLTCGVDSQDPDFQISINYLGSSVSTYINQFEFVQAIHRFRHIQNHNIYSSNIKSKSQSFIQEITPQQVFYKLHKNDYKSDYKYINVYSNDLMINYNVIYDSIQNQMKNEGLYITSALLKDMGYQINLFEDIEFEKIELEQLDIKKKKQPQFKISKEEIETLNYIQNYGTNTLNDEQLKISNLKEKYQRFKHIKQYLQSEQQDINSKHYDKLKQLKVDDLVFSDYFMQIQDQIYELEKQGLLEKYIAQFELYNNIKYLVKYDKNSYKQFNYHQPTKDKVNEQDILDYKKSCLDIEKIILPQLLQQIFDILTNQKMSDNIELNKYIKKYECLALVYLKFDLNVYKNNLTQFIDKEQLLPKFQKYYDLTFEDQEYIEILKELDINPYSRQTISEILKTLRLRYERYEKRINGEKSTITELFPVKLDYELTEEVKNENDSKLDQILGLSQLQLDEYIRQQKQN